MEKALAELLAKQEIAEIIYRVARGTDRGNVELYASGFHEDHAVSNILIDLCGDAATAGYLDRFERRSDQQWKIARRIFGRRDKQDLVYTHALLPGFE